MNRASLPKPVEWAITFMLCALFVSFAAFFLALSAYGTYAFYLAIINMRAW